MSYTVARVLTKPVSSEQTREAPSDVTRLTLYRSFNERLEDLTNEFSSAQLVSQAELEQFLCKLGETDPQNHQRISWILSILLYDVIGLALSQENNALRKLKILEFYNKFKALLQEIQPQDVTADQMIERYIVYKNQKASQDQRLVDTTEIATEQIEEACQYANDINQGIIHNFEQLIGRIQALNNKRQTLRLEHQKKLDELSNRAYAALRQIQNLSKIQGQVGQKLKEDGKSFEQTLQSFEGLLNRIQKL
jgi:hypothetical protein